MTSLILAAALMGQCPGNVCPQSQQTQAPQLYRLVDSAGKPFESYDPKLLNAYITKRNAEIKAAKSAEHGCPCGKCPCDACNCPPVLFRFH